MELTEEQLRTLREASGHAIVRTDAETQPEYVLIRAVLYERLKRFVYEDSPPTDEEKRDQ